MSANILSRARPNHFYRAIKVEIVLVSMSFIVCLFEIVKFRDSSENAWAWFHRKAHKNLETR